jgi:hypothetical protein
MSDLKSYGQPIKHDSKKEEQIAELHRIKKDFMALATKAEGMFFTDNGYRPNALVQSRNRFSEAMMWLQYWIEVRE